MTSATINVSSATPVAEILDLLAQARREHLDLRLRLADLEREALKHKVVVTSLLIARNGEAGIGKTDADKARTIDAALAADGEYSDVQARLLDAKDAVAASDVSITILAEYFQHARLAARVKMAEAIAGRGIEDI